nr:hypothetical protein [Lachnospiraceae bacterium]
AAEQGEVLGVSRETAEVTPVDNEGAVLGETRNPQTSDHSNAGLWLSLMAASAACIAVLSKKKENDER